MPPAFGSGVTVTATVNGNPTTAVLGARSEASSEPPPAPTSTARISVARAILTTDIHVLYTARPDRVPEPESSRPRHEVATSSSAGTASLDPMAKAAVNFACTECGYSAGRWFGKCQGCTAFG